MSLSKPEEVVFPPAKYGPTSSWAWLLLLKAFEGPMSDSDAQRANQLFDLDMKEGDFAPHVAVAAAMMLMGKQPSCSQAREFRDLLVRVTLSMPFVHPKDAEQDHLDHTPFAKMGDRSAAILKAVAAALRLLGPSRPFASSEHRSGWAAVAGALFLFAMDSDFEVFELDQVRFLTELVNFAIKTLQQHKEKLQSEGLQSDDPASVPLAPGQKQKAVAIDEALAVLKRAQSCPISAIFNGPDDVNPEMFSKLERSERYRANQLKEMAEARKRAEEQEKVKAEKKKASAELAAQRKAEALQRRTAASCSSSVVNVVAEGIQQQIAEGEQQQDMVMD